MQKDPAQNHLAEADQNIDDARGRIAAQKATVDELVRLGHRTTQSAALLATFEEALQQMLAHRDIVRHKLRHG